MLPQVRLCLATPADAEAIAQVVRRAWADRVALDGAEVVGTVRHPDPRLRGVWEIRKLGVLPEYRQQGVAHRLMEALLRQAFELRARELRLAVRHDQPKLLKWYTQFGFTYDPSLRYSTPNPHFVMTKKLEVP